MILPQRSVRGKEVGKILKTPNLYLVIMLVILGCFAADIQKTDRELTRNRLSSRDGWNYHFAVDLGETDTWFAEEFTRGAEEEAQKYGIALEIKGRNSSYQEGDTGFIQWACDANMDAVISSGEDVQSREEISGILNRSLTDCAVICNDVPYEESIYIGTDNYQEGYYLGKLLGEKYEGRDAEIVLLYGEVERQIKDSRVKGFCEALDVYPNIRIVEMRALKPNILEAMGQAEEILLNRESLQEFVCFGENILDGTARGVIDLNRVKTIDISGIGDSRRIQDYMEKGILDLVVSGDYYAMGREAVQALYRKKKGEETEDRRILVTFAVKTESGEEEG